MTERPQPDRTDAGVQAFIDYIRPMQGGPMVRVLDGHCSACKEKIYPGPKMPRDWCVEAEIVRALSTQWHTDDCPGPILFATQPVEEKE